MAKRTRMLARKWLSVGVVDVGANAECDTIICKRKDSSPAPATTDQQRAEITAKLGALHPGLVAKMDEMAETFNDVVSEQDARRALCDAIYALQDSLISIREDDTVQDKAGLAQQSIAQFTAVVLGQITAKIGAKVSAARMTQLKAALAALQSIITEAEGTMAQTDGTAAKLDTLKLDADTKKKVLEWGASVDKLRTDAEAEAAKLKTQLDTLTAEVTALKAKQPATEEDVLKSLPEPLRTRFQETEKRAKDAEIAAKAERDTRVTAEWNGKVMALKRLPVGVDPAKPADDAALTGFAAVMKRIDEGVSTPADAVEVMRVLKAADEMARLAGVFKELGAGGGADTGAAAWEQIETKAKAEMATDKTLTIHKARDIVMQREPELVKQYHEQRGATH
jgi:hypothetical protein